MGWERDGSAPPPKSPSARPRRRFGTDAFSSRGLHTTPGATQGCNPLRNPNSSTAPTPNAAERASRGPRDGTERAPAPAQPTPAPGRKAAPPPVPVVAEQPVAEHEPAALVALQVVGPLEEPALVGVGARRCRRSPRRRPAAAPAPRSRRLRAHGAAAGARQLVAGQARDGAEQGDQPAGAAAAQRGRLPHRPRGAAPRPRDAAPRSAGTGAGRRRAHVTRRRSGGGTERRRAREEARGESAPWRRGGKGARPLSLSGCGVPQPPAILLPPPFCGPARPPQRRGISQSHRTAEPQRSLRCKGSYSPPRAPLPTRSGCPGSHSPRCWTRQQPLVSRGPTLHTAPSEAPRGPSPSHPSPLCLLPPTGRDLLSLIWLICSHPTNRITARPSPAPLAACMNEGRMNEGCQQLGVSHREQQWEKWLPRPPGTPPMRTFSLEPEELGQAAPRVKKRM